MPPKQQLPKLLVIVGETASGKSSLALELAKRLNGEIICADSQTIRKEANIGTSKPSKSDQKVIKHHLLDIIGPNEPFNVAQFKDMANEAINDIAKRGKTPIMVGGTGLYIDSVIYDYQFGSNQADKTLRSNTLILGIQTDRQDLKQKVYARTHKMIDEGLAKEAKSLANKYGWDCEALQAIGYREWREYFAEKPNDKSQIEQIPIEETEAKINKDTLELAKKQRTWFKRNKSIQWLSTPVNADTTVDLATTFFTSN